MTAGIPSSSASGLARGKRLGDLLGMAKAAHGAGRLGVAEGLYKQVLKARPAEAVEAYRCLAILCSQADRLPEAMEHLAQGLRLDPQDAALLNDLGSIYQRTGRSEDAIGAYRQAVALRPNFAAAHLNLGTALHQQGRLTDAVDSYRRALAVNPKIADAHLNFGVALQQLECHEEAETAFRSALAIDPRLTAAYFDLGITLAAQGRLDAAVAAYRSALAIKPDDAAVHVNLGITFRQKHELQEAVACFRRAVELDPSLSVALFNLGQALGDLGLADEALICYRRAVTIDPESAGAHRALAVTLRDRGVTEEAFAVFRRHNDLVYQQQRSRGQLPIPLHRTKHDREQLDYLADTALVAEAASLREHAPDSRELFHERFEAIYHIEGGQRIEGAAVSPNADARAIEARWAEGRPKIVVVDNLLTATALDELRRFCWGSTIWRIEYGDGYLGSMMASGFAAPLIGQIATELAVAFPGIFRRHPLLQAWAFKYDSGLRGINVHADFAAVNVNFWITPDEANLDPESGGLVIWDQPAPLDWDFGKYNKQTDQIREFLSQSGAKSVTVPYRANRAIIFDSDLFHETDRIAFKEGYLNRRINVTFLYGVREHAPPRAKTGMS